MCSPAFSGDRGASSEPWGGGKVQVEVEERFFSDEIKELEKLSKKIAFVLQSALGLSVKVTLVEPKTIQRSEGKAKRVIDKRVFI